MTELARLRGSAFDKVAKGHAFARAAIIDPAFKALLVEVYRRLEARRSTHLLLEALEERPHRARRPFRENRAVPRGFA